MRSEQEIFEELAQLCLNPGYVHVIAYFCFRDNFVRFEKEITPEDNHFLLLQHYGLVEALYDGPFYWMGRDRCYVDSAMRNRGNFTEEFSHQRLELVFGRENVYRGVDIYGTDGNKISDVNAGDKMHR